MKYQSCPSQPLLHNELSALQPRAQSIFHTMGLAAPTIGLAATKAHKAHFEIPNSKFQIRNAMIVTEHLLSSSNENVASSIIKEYESPAASMTVILSAAIVASRSGLRNK
jgi:hypothetical protein